MQQQFTAQEWLKFVGKERLQAFQDAFTRMYGISLCFLDAEGRALTVWSNSSIFCHTMMKNASQERCKTEKSNALVSVRAKHKTEIFICYMGLTYFMCPVYFDDKLVAVAYGGGIVFQDSLLPEEIIESYHIKKFSQKNLTILCELLTETLKLLNFNIERWHEINNDISETLKAKNIFNDKLSKREEEVARLICTGISNKEIAGKLFISEKTVKTHVSNILIKLDLKDRMQLIVDFGRDINNT